MAQDANHLKATQRLLFKLITAPEGVKKALRESPKISLPLKGDRRLSAVERLDIYANMYFYRIRDALKEDFPALLQVIGEIAFHNLITDYLLKYPSRHYSLREAGRYLPGFLKKYRPLQKYPYLFELATMEWALLEAFDAADSPVLTKEDLAAVSPDRWKRLQFQFIPSFHSYGFSWRVDQILENTLKGVKVRRLHPQPQVLIVWRREFKVFYRPLDEWETKLLKKLEQGSPFGEMCEFLTKKIGGEKASLLMARYLQVWLGEGLFSRFSNR